MARLISTPARNATAVPARALTPPTPSGIGCVPKMFNAIGETRMLAAITLSGLTLFKLHRPTRLIVVGGFWGGMGVGA